MKFFSTQLITLVITATSLAAPLLDKREDFDDVSEACKQAIKQYDECINDTIFELKDLNSICTSFNSEKCQNFKKNGYLLGLNECKNEEEIEIKLSNDLIESYYIETKYRCTNDESGNICSINKYELENSVRSNYEQALKDSCKSEACSNAYVEYADDLLKLLDSVENDVKEKINVHISKTKEKLDSGLEEARNKIKKGPFGKRDADNLEQSIKARRDYLVSNKCTTNGKFTVNESVSSGATSVTKINTLVIAVILIIVTLI